MYYLPDRLNEVEPSPLDHLVTFLRKGVEEHHLSSSVVSSSRLRYTSFHKNEDFIQFLPIRFVQFSDRLFCSGIPRTRDELLTISEYFGVNVLVNFGICPLNSDRMISIDCGQGLLGFEVKYVDVDRGMKTPLEDIFEVYNIPVLPDSTPSPRVIEQVKELFINLHFNRKTACFICFDGLAVNYMMAILFNHFVHEMGVEELKKYVSRFQRRDQVTIFSMSQTMYLFHNPSFPLNNKYYVGVEEVFSPSNLIKRQLSFLRSKFFEDALMDSIRVEYEPFLVIENIPSSNRSEDKKNKKRLRMVHFREKRRKLLDRETVKFLFEELPREMTRKIIGDYPTLLNELKEFFSIVHRRVFRKEFINYWELLMGTTFENCVPSALVKEQIEKFKGEVFGRILVDEKIEKMLSSMACSSDSIGDSVEELVFPSIHNPAKSLAPMKNCNNVQEKKKKKKKKKKLVFMKEKGKKLKKKKNRNRNKEKKKKLKKLKKDEGYQDSSPKKDQESGLLRVLPTRRKRSLSCPGQRPIFPNLMKMKSGNQALFDTTKNYKKKVLNRKKNKTRKKRKGKRRKRSLSGPLPRPLFLKRLNQN